MKQLKLRTQSYLLIRVCLFPGYCKITPNGCSMLLVSWATSKCQEERALSLSFGKSQCLSLPASPDCWHAYARGPPNSHLTFALTFVSTSCVDGCWEWPSVHLPWYQRFVLISCFLIVISSHLIKLVELIRLIQRNLRKYCFFLNN